LTALTPHLLGSAIEKIGHPLLPILFLVDKGPVNITGPAIESAAPDQRLRLHRCSPITGLAQFYIQLIILYKDLVKVIDRPEIIELILIGLADDPFVNHIKDDIAEIDRFPDAPVFEDRFRHETEAPLGKVPDPFEQLLTRDMTVDSQFLSGVEDCLKDKKIGLDRVTGIVLDDLPQDPRIVHAIILAVKPDKSRILQKSDEHSFRTLRSDD
jgi:hypothetical protein